MENMRYAKTGYTSMGEAYLEVVERVYDDGNNLNYTDHVVASYSLRYLEDTNESRFTLQGR